MRTIKKQIRLYKFNELDKVGKNIAISTTRDLLIDKNWAKKVIKALDLEFTEDGQIYEEDEKNGR